MALIRRSPSNLTKIPGTTTLSIVRGGVTTTPTGSGPLDQFKLDLAPGGAGLETNIKVTGRTDFQTYVPTEAQKAVLRPQNIIGGQYIQVERVTGDFQTGKINIEYSTPTFASKSKPEPMSNKVVSSSNAAALSRLLGRQVTAGTRLSIADVQRINTPGAAYPSTGPSRGFTGGQGYGQLFPIDPDAFALAQKAVAASRIKSLGLQAAYRVKTSAGVSKSIGFTNVSIIRPK